ncbi:hypothetical protein FH972_000260 [Carpinus fangiana]|uniref:Uncharacterized protein n=1 Tax=Carpinus fangiana TaxID=176857 RepID=A0A5N6Q8L4_9ROSI|nr:hypothetical protein FH972_000260 [Carpinus fangiana]
MAELYGMEKPDGGGGVFVEVTEGDETERLNNDNRGQRGPPPGARSRRRTASMAFSDVRVFLTM